MRRLIVFAVVLAVASALLIGVGLGSNAPGLLIMPLCITGPAFFMILGALISRVSLDYQLVPKSAAHTPRQRARAVTGDGYSDV
ncbi:MAG: hypothetical protein KJ065_09305 [Anaerolineae bacterium]|nr:hypothetical protein [Anaerolineae bacterium]